MLPKISFTKVSVPTKGVAVLFVDDTLALGAQAKAVLGAGEGVLARAAAAGNFTGKARGVLDILAPAGLEVERLIVIGLGKAEDIAGLGETDWSTLGGIGMEN